MSLTPADVPKIFDVLDNTDNFDYVEVTLGDHALTAGNTAATMGRTQKAPASKPPLTFSDDQPPRS